MFRTLTRRGAAALLSLATAGVLVAGLSTAAASASTAGAYSKDIAGYQTGRWVRFIKTDFRLPSTSQCAGAFTTHSPQGDGVAITLGPAEESNAGVPQSAGDASTIGVSFVPSTAGCGLISPSFATNVLTGTTTGVPLDGTVTLNPGDSGWISLYYSQGAQFTEAVIVDTTNGTHAHASFDGKATYVGGSVTAGFGPYTPTGTKVKLWALKPQAVTTYTGVHGNLATFRPQRITMTSDGTPAGATYAWPGGLWGGSNFSVFGR